MILWIYKLVNSARRAFAGRKHPHQLAWAVAFGALLGVIPHGNLLAVIVLLVVLSLKLNHAMAGLIAVGTAFLAPHLDPYSHQVGQAALSQPDFREAAAKAWQLPLVPWTDLNNTIVMGSFLIGLGMLLPIFGLTYPVFRTLAPRKFGETRPSRLAKGRKRSHAARSTAPGIETNAHQIVMIDQGHVSMTPPHNPENADCPKAERWTDPSATLSTVEIDSIAEGDTESCEVEFVEVDADSSPDEHQVSVETRIDVIRMKDHRSTGSTDAPDDLETTNGQPMDEALNYLLRQLRDSQQKQRKAA